MSGLGFTKGGNPSVGFTSGGSNTPIADALKRKNECSLTTEDKDTVCSSAEHISKVAKMVAEHSGQAAPTSAKAIIKEAMKITNCGTESCLYNTSELGAYMSARDVDEALKNFKPIGPAENTDLLNNNNIDKIGADLALANPGHTHLKFEMIDFNERSTPLAVVDMNSILSGNTNRTSMSCVLNTDKKGGRGIHWFCLFADANPLKKTVNLEYFNSSGRAPAESVYDWLHSNQAKLTNAGWKCEIIRVCAGCVQEDNHSCGVWCLCYIWARLRGIPGSWFCAGKATDADMLKLRGMLFRDA